MKEPISRRVFLKKSAMVAGWAAAASILAACGIEPSVILPPEDILPMENPYLKLGSPEDVDLSPLNQYPDIQTPFFIDGSGHLRGFVTAGQNCFLINVDRNTGKTSLVKSYAVVYPDQSKYYKKNYAGISGVVQPDPKNLDFLIGAMDYEQQTKNWWEFRGRVGYGISMDGGLTWAEKGPIIEGHDPLDPGVPSPKANNEIRPTGAVHPWCVLRTIEGRKYLYTYYTDLTSDLSRSNQICLSRSALNPQGELGEQELLTSVGAFVLGGEKLGLEPKRIFPIPPAGIYTAYPSIYAVNGGFLGLFESEPGFFACRSLNGLDWDNPVQIIKFPMGENEAKAKKQRWFSAPSLLMEGNLSYLIYSDSVTGNGSHRMKRMPCQLLV